MSRYIVDHWFLWSSGDLRRRRFAASDRESADRRFDACVGVPGTTRVVMRLLGPNGSSSALRVYAAPLRSSAAGGAGAAPSRKRPSGGASSPETE